MKSLKTQGRRTFGEPQALTLPAASTQPLGPQREVAGLPCAADAAFGKAATI